MASKFPASESATNEHNYYRLLSGEEIPEATRSALMLYRSNPKMLSYRVTLALAYLRNHDTQSAYALLNANRIEWDEQSDINKAVRAATLKEKQPKKAEALIDTINLDSLFTEEKKLFLGCR